MTHPAISRELPETIIRPIAGGEHVDPRKVWEFRHLLWSLVCRDVRVKFDALHLGLLWSTARPLMMVLVVTIFRGAHEGERLGGLPYPMFLYVGLIFWFYFSDSLIESASAVQRDAAMVSKVFFPRIISPLVSVLANLADVGIGLVPIIGFAWYYRIVPGWNLLALPLIVVVFVVLALGGGLIFSRLILSMRDFERVLQLIVYIGLFASPVFHAMEAIPERFMPLVHINPTTGALLAVRGCFVSDPAVPFPWQPLAVSAFTAGILLILGVSAFRRMQERLIERL